MKQKVLLACILALFPIGFTFIVFGYRLAQALGYYLLLIDGLFGVVAVILIRAYKRTERTSL